MAEVAGKVDILREATWLNGRRTRAYAIILAVMFALASLVYLALSHPPLDPTGKALGTDFASFWTASQLALDGHPASAWNLPAHHAAQARMFGEDAGYAAFFYPPPFLLVCLPLALTGYGAALLLWLAATGAAWVATCRAWLRRQAWLPIFAFPAVLINAGHGQNGFLTAALFGGGALLCGRRPWLGGALLGALVIKPHLAVLVPLFLIFTGNWRAFVAAGLSAVALCLLSLAAFGPDAWRAFLEASPIARQALEQDGVGFGKMQSLFAAARLLGAPVGFAWALQGVGGLFGLIMLWRIRRSGDDRARGAALVCASLLATPFLLDYDLTVLAFPLAWLFIEAQDGGWRPWERFVGAGAFVLPLVSRALATNLHLPLAPVVFCALLFCVCRRASAGVGPEGKRAAAAA